MTTFVLILGACALLALNVLIVSWVVVVLRDARADRECAELVRENALLRAQLADQHRHLISLGAKAESIELCRTRG